MIAIETTMEKIARVYSKNTGIRIVFGPVFGTDSKSVIYVLPIPDRADKKIKFMTEVETYHELGHVLWTDYDRTKNKMLHIIRNTIEDPRVDRLFAEQWPGAGKKRRKLLKEVMIPEYVNVALANPTVSLFEKLLKVTLTRSHEHWTGLDLGMIVPNDVDRLWKEKCEPFMDRIKNVQTSADVVAVADDLYEKLKDTTPPSPPSPPMPMPGMPQDGDGEDGDGQQVVMVSSDEEDQENQPQNQTTDSGDDTEKEDGDEGNKSVSGKGDEDKGSDTAEDESSDSETDKEAEDQEDVSGMESESDSGGDSGERDEKDSSGGSVSGEQDSGDDSVQDTGDEDGQEQDTDSAGSVEDGEDSPAGEEEEPVDENEDARNQLAGEIEDEIDTKSADEEMVEQLNQYAQSHHLYREAPGLKDRFVRRPYYPSWPSVVEAYERRGQELTGYARSKLRTLFISERCPRWNCNQRSGRLDLKKLWNDDSETIFRKRSVHVHEDAVVSMVIDNSSSMRGGNDQTASALLTTLASELDKLRIPFECVGFTAEWDSSDAYNPDCNQGVRRTPAIINIIKNFEEPYRKVRYRFVWPDNSNITVELPAIRYAAKRLAQRRESKKIMFILSDGNTESGNPNLDRALVEATKDFIDRILQAGIYVVGFGLEDTSIRNYVKDVIEVIDLDKFPREFYTKLMSILLRR